MTDLDKDIEALLSLIAKLKERYGAEWQPQASASEFDELSRLLDRTGIHGRHALDVTSGKRRKPGPKSFNEIDTTAIYRKWNGR